MQNRVLPYNTIGNRPKPNGYAGYQGYQGGANAGPKPVQSVSEILSQGLPEMTPDLMRAQGTAGRQRQIADMLMQGAMEQDNTSLAGGLSSLGQAFFARGAGKKADKAEAEAQSVQSMLVQKAMQGDQASIAQLLAGDPAAAIGRMDQQKRYSVEDALAEKQFGLQERGVNLDERGLEYSMMDGDRQFGLSTDQFNEGRRQFDQGYALDAELGRGGLNVQRGQLDLGYAELDQKRAAAEAEAASVGAGVTPGLAGLPAGVQSAIVSNELGQIDTAATNRGQSDELLSLADEWLRQAEGYTAQGGSWLQDAGQAFSQKTAPLKGLTEKMVMLAKKPGTGPMTDDDAKRAQKATLNINQGPEANKAVREIYAAKAQNDRDYEAWMREAQNIFGYGAANQANQIWMEYSRANPVYDTKTGVPVERVPVTQWLGSQTAAPAATPNAASGPPVGTVKNGYRFKGGNPNDQNSWEPAQ